MPVTMPHASMGEVLEMIRYQDRAIAAIPEVELVVGKLGRAESPLDPAPLAMFETVIQIDAINLSVAVWVGFVGFLALFGIATDDGVVVATYLDQSLTRRRIDTIADIRAATVEAGRRRIRPMLMTTATTILALLPVLTSTGRGADVMVPMAVPSVGGATIAILNTLVVPVLYCAVQERKLKWNIAEPRFAEHR